MKLLSYTPTFVHHQYEFKVLVLLSKIQLSKFNWANSTEQKFNWAKLNWSNIQLSKIQLSKIVLSTHLIEQTFNWANIIPTHSNKWYSPFFSNLVVVTGMNTDKFIHGKLTTAQTNAWCANNINVAHNTVVCDSCDYKKFPRDISQCICKQYCPW